MEDFSGSGALSGGASGATIGTSMMPGWGTLIGAGMGALGGGFLGRSKGPNFGMMNDLISQRQNEIEAFEKKLEAARGNILSNYQNLQATTMARFMPMAEAQLGGRGLTVGSGAFASALAKEAAGLQSGYNTLNANMTEQNLYDVEGMRQQLFNDRLGITNQQTTLPWLAGRQNTQDMFSSLGDLGKTLAGSGLFSNRMAPSSIAGYESFNDYNNRLTGANNF